MLAANPNLTSYTHAMTRLPPSTPTKETILAANPNLTSYTRATTRLLPPTPNTENLISYTHVTTRLPLSAVAAAKARPPSAFFLCTRYDPASVTDSHHGARTDGASESHFPTTPPLTTADPLATATSAATSLVTSSSPDATENTADHSSAPTPPAADDTTATAPPITETPTFPPPLHVPVGAKDGTPAASSSPDVALGTADGVMAAAASAAETDAHSRNAPSLRPVRTWERAMGLMVHDVTSNNSSAQGWSGGIRAG